jgi:hypothetical protein
MSCTFKVRGRSSINMAAVDPRMYERPKPELLPPHIVTIDRLLVCQADTSQHHRMLLEAKVRVA